MNFAGNRCLPAKWRFDRIRPAFPPWREAVTVGVTAAPRVVVMNRDDDPGGDGAGTASVLARTLGGAKAPNTRFTDVRPAPTVKITGTNPERSQEGDQRHGSERRR